MYSQLWLKYLMLVGLLTSCEGSRNNMPSPLQVNVWPFDLGSGVRVTCDVGYLCANFSLPNSNNNSNNQISIAPYASYRGLGLSVLDLGPMYATDRQTSDAHHRLMPPLYRGGGITSLTNDHWTTLCWGKHPLWFFLKIGQHLPKLWARIKVGVFMNI